MSERPSLRSRLLLAAGLLAFGVLLQYLVKGSISSLPLGIVALGVGLVVGSTFRGRADVVMPSGVVLLVLMFVVLLAGVAYADVSVPRAEQRSFLIVLAAADLIGVAVLAVILARLGYPVVRAKGPPP